MEIKICGKCKIPKEILEFTIRNKTTGLRNGYCKSCMKKYQADYYQRNKTKTKERRQITSSLWGKKRRVELQEWNEKLKDKPCRDCNGSFPPYVMQFDHLPEQEKVSCIATMIHSLRPQEIILEEIKKCELVCANCHAIRTHRRKEEIKKKAWRAYGNR